MLISSMSYVEFQKRLYRHVDFKGQGPYLYSSAHNRLNNIGKRLWRYDDELKKYNSVTWRSEWRDVKCCRVHLNCINSSLLYLKQDSYLNFIFKFPASSPNFLNCKLFFPCKFNYLRLFHEKTPYREWNKYTKLLYICIRFTFRNRTLLIRV